jgi:hypothetical protein
MLHQEMEQEMDAAGRIRRAQQLRATVTDPTALVACARRLLDATPRQCRHLVAFCPEGQAVAAAASALAMTDGWALSARRASHVAPLAPGPEDAGGWLWMSVEEALGLGPVRAWVMRWAQERGGKAPLAPMRQPLLAEVA